MREILRFGLALSIGAMLVAGSAMAQNNNPCPGAKEYQVNIIGVAKGKNPDMTGNNGHRIFVNLSGKSQINMTGDTSSEDGLQCGNSFYVADANGTDGSATLVVPCDPLTAENLNPSACYDVFATPLGTPGGQADVDVVCEFDDTCLNCDTMADSCATGTVDFSLARGNGGKPVTQDITNHFRADGCIDIAGEVGVCDKGDISFNNEWIFNIEQLLYYYWDYDNDGLRVAQVRFCDAEGGANNCGGGTIVQ